eukprot:scaffold248686_cov32-Tisochrysis_lutea.AAC.1
MAIRARGRSDRWLPREPSSSHVCASPLRFGLLFRTGRRRCPRLRRIRGASARWADHRRGAGPAARNVHRRRRDRRLRTPLHQGPKRHVRRHGRTPALPNGRRL